MTVAERSDRNPPQRHHNLTTWSNRTGHRLGPFRSTALPNWALSGSMRRLRRRWPGVIGGLSLGRPARRTPGHSTPGTQVKTAHTTRRPMRRSRLPRLGGVASHAIGYADHGSGDYSQGSAPARKTGTDQATAAEGRAVGSRRGLRLHPGRGGEGAGDGSGAV